MPFASIVTFLLYGTPLDDAESDYVPISSLELPVTKLPSDILKFPNLTPISLTLSYWKYAGSLILIV